MHIHTYAHTCTYIHVHTHIHTYAHTYIHTMDIHLIIVVSCNSYIMPRVLYWIYMHQARGLGVYISNIARVGVIYMCK